MNTTINTINGAIKQKLSQLRALRRVLPLISLTVLALFGQVAQAQITPGGVSSGLSLWLKADAGISETAGAVSAWEDQSSSSFDLTQSNSVSQPLWKGASELMNFNPVVDFDGLDDNLAYIPSSLIDVRDMTMFVVGEEEVRQDAYPITLRYNSTTDNIIVNQAFSGDNECLLELW
ncbi:hypothetical protein [Ostreibacterium oceani]|uniref:Uncharacterized protein n=1 Tax=Ostreibacterium oceani TaxID=2654998 RepID=A0A6N7EYG0_9GAMM|nr:hypothetical protein [Ostreibacterium oceani]MPV86595.1 hypothetical protein [Ostreibacterium oceani]